ncbi:TPA: PLxRFG domain-containing protein [Aeromonas hydrophila]
MDKPGLRDALPQPKLSDTRTDPFWGNLDSSLSAAAAQSAVQTPQRDLNVGLGDVARGVGAGALDLVGGIGELSRQASQFGKENAGKQGGDYLEQARANMASKLSPVLDVVAGAGDLAKSGAESLTEGMSGDAKEAIGRSLIDETPEGRLTLGDGAGDLDVWAMKMAQGVGSLLPTLAAGGVTGVAAKVSIGRAVTASMVKRGATQKVAEAVAAKAVSKIAYGASVTTGVTGSVGSAGVNARDTVLGMSFDELSRSDTFRQAFTRIDQDQQTQHLSDEEKLSLAREETANLASRATMSDAKVWGAAAMGSMMGDAMLFKMLAGKAATGGVLKGAAKGAVGEGIGETLEEGVQQYAVNESLNEVAAADIDPMKGVMSSAIEGGLIGMGAGGAVGAVGGARGGKHASQEDGVGTDPVSEPSAPVTEGAAGPAVDPNFASVPLEEGEQAPSASQAEGELNPLGPSASQFDELRDVPAYLRQDDTADRFKGMAQDSDVQRALAGEYGRSVQELVASQMQAGDQGKSLYERAQAGELGLDPFAGNKSAQQVAMENQRLALPLKDVIFAGDANAKPKGEAVAAPGDHDDQQAGPGPQFRGGERTRWQSGQEGDVLPPEASSTKPAGELPGAVIEGEAREVGNELPHRNVVYGNDLRAEQQRAADLARRERELNNQPLQIGQSETLFAGGTPGADPRNSAYTPPRLSRDQVDTSMGEQSTRDPRSPVAQSIEQAGSATDSVFGPLKSLRITRKGKPFATEKEAAMASRKGQEMPVPLNGGGFGVAAIGEVQQAQAQQGAVKQPSSNSAQQDRQDGKTEIAQNGMVIVHGSGNPGMSEQDIQIVRASGQKQGKKGRVYGGFYGTSEQDAHQAQAYADMMGGTPTLYDVKIKPGTKVLHKQGDITRLSESYINELVSQGYGVVTGTDPRGQTEHVVIDKSAVASMAPRGAQATPSQVNDTNVADMRQPSDQPAASVSAETVPAPSATAGEASQLAPAIDTGYREVIPVKQPKTEVSNEPVTPVPAISSERSGDQPGAGDPVATSVGPTPAELAERAGPGDPADGTSLAPVPVTQPGEKNALTAPAPAGVAVSEGGQPEQARTTAGPAAAPTPWSGMIDNPDGTITLEGEVAALKSWAKDNGVKAIPGKGGLVVAKSFTAKVRGLTAPAANEPSALVEAARGGVVPEPTEVDLIDRDLLKEHAGRWKYRSAVGAGWFTANTKEAAIERAEEAYRKAVSKGEPVPTRDERFAQADAELFSEMDRRYGKMSTPELEAEYQRLGGEVGDLQKSGSGEFNGNGGRRTGAAVSNEGARQVGEERLRLGVYMKMRRDREGAKSQQIEPANDWRGAKSATDYHAAKRRLFSGEMEFSEFQAMSRSALDNAPSLRAELENKTKQDLLDQMSRFNAARYKNDKKAVVVEAAYNQLIGDLRWAANGDGNTISETYAIGGARQSIEERVAKALDGLTPERYQQFVNKQRADVAKRDAELAATKEALRDPQTLEQFKTFLKYRSLDKLTPEQRARYEDLIAASNLDKRDQANEVKAATAVTPTASGDIIKTKHTKSGEDLFVVQMGDRVDRDTYNQINAHAKKLGGWYSSYKVGGAVPGFQFKDEAKATEFRGWLTGQGAASAAPSAEAAPTEVTDPDQDNSKSKQVETLRTRAKTLRDKATAALNAERKENTNKRMTEAANARANAESELHFAWLLDAIADGIESGEVTYLRNLANGTQLTELNHALSRSLWNLPPARREALTSQGMIERTEDGRERWSAKATPEMMAEGAQMPGMDYFARNLKDVATKMQGASGFKQAGAKIMALVNAAINRDSKTVSITDPELIAKLKAYTSGVSDYDAKAVKEQIGGYSRLERMGITNHTELRAALRELARLQAGLKKQAVPRDPLAEKMVALKRKLVGNRNAFIDFFPTPESHAADLVALAGIEPGMTVLEPSAGHGMLAEAARAAGAKVDAVELAGDLREILQAKGFGLVGSDFMATTPAQSYDAVVMNPPFSGDMDVDHVRHAYDHLKPGGRLVAIVSATAGDRQNNKNKAFREWFDGLGGSEQAMPEGSFKASLNPTDVRTKIFVIDKPANEAKPLPSPEGKRVTVATPKGQSVEVQYRVMEAADLVASHDFEGNLNHDYPQQLQPRDRSKQTYRVQVGQIAAAPDGARLAASPETDRGAPIVRDGIVESGNGRSIGLRQAYQRGDADAYRRYIEANAADFGIDPAVIGAMKQPVLVRERITTMTDDQLRDFVVDSNTDAKMANSAAEDAGADAGKLTDDMLDLLNIPEGGDVLASQNNRFLQAFLSAIGENQSNSYVSRDGQWNDAYRKRVTAAIFAYGYDNQRLLDAATGEVDADGRNITTALINNAVGMAKLRQHSPERAKVISNYLAEAVESIARAKRSGQSLQEMAAQSDMLGGDTSPEGSLLAQAIAASARSAKAITGMVGDILTMLNKTTSADMFGAAVDPATPETAINETLKAISAYNQQKASQPKPGGDLFGLAGARNNHGAAPSVPRSGDASAAKGAGGVTEGRLELDGVSIRIPAIDEEQQRLYNQATHRGQGVNFASGISTGVGRILNDLKDAGLLDTAEQRAAAEAEVQAWANEEAINARKLMRDGIKTPSWVITGRSGRKAQSSAATERENNRQTQHYKDQDARIKALRDELKKLRPKEVIGRESFNYAWGKARGMIAEYASALSGGQPNLLASLRKSMNSELSRYLQAMEKIDAQGFIKTLSEQDNRLKAAGYDGLVAIVGARSNPGKIISDAINGRIRFSKQAMAQGEKPAKHLTRKEAELVTKEWFKQYRGASGIDVQIHATQAELEKALGLAAQDGLIRRAAFDDDSGTLHVAADTIANPKRMREILRHEVLAHYGLANVLGDGEYTKLMSRLIQSQKDPSMKPVWDWVNTHYADEDIGTQAEEVVAHLAELEQGALGRGWDRVVAWVTRALRAVGFVPDGITAAETRSLIEGLGKKLKRSGPDDNGPDGDKKFSQEVDLPTEISQDSVGKTIDVSGVERPTINHDGQPIHQTEEGLRNFWRWFGNSLMRDGAGNPVVVYHATESDITAFNTRDAVENRSFYYGEDNGREKDAGGFFFTPDKTLANDYAENRPNANIIPVYLKLNNPVYLDEMSLEEQGNYLREARANGHDGAIIGDGLEYVVFTPEQIKSAIGNNGEYSKSNPDVRFSQTNTAADDSKTLEQSIKQKAVYQAGAALSSVKNWLKQGRPVMLGTLTDLQIDQLYRDITGGAVSAYQRLRTKMEAERNDILLDAETRIDPLWDALEKQEKADLSSLMHDATMSRLHPDKPLDENSYYLEAKQKVERAKKPETKAAYEAELHIIERNHSELARQYQALTPKAKALYATMEQTYNQQWETLREAIEQRLVDLLGENKGRAMAATMRLKMESALKHGPYFPLTRFGDYVVKARKGDEYVREHFERRIDAEQAVKLYQRDGYNALMTVKEEGNGDSANAHQLGMELLDFLEEAEGVSKDQLQDTIWQAMLKMMPDASYAKHAIHRRRVKGASRDAHRAYMSSVYHFARHVSKIRYGHKMQGELDKLSEQVLAGVTGEPSSIKPEDLEIAQQVLNEMNKRHDMNMNPTGKAWAGHAGNAGFLYYIGPSLASAVVNMTQNFTVMLPQLGAKYGFAKSASAMTAAMGDYIKHGKFKAGTTEAWQSLTRSTTLKADELALLKELYRAGVLDLTQAHSVAAKADTDQQDAKVMSKHWRKAMRWAGATFHNAEVLNREVAALAAYRLLKEAEPTLSAEQYAEKVTEMVYDGHGNYAASNRPRYMRNDVVKVMTQFKIYSQMMTYVIYSNAIKAAKGDKQAAKTLGGIMAAHWVMAGVMGLPVPITWVAYALAAAADDDDDRSGEASFRLGLTEALGPRAGELLAKGPLDSLTNLSIAGRTGLNDLWWRSPKEGTEGDDLAWHAVQQLLGPVAGIGINLVRGGGQIVDGEIQRGLETVLPKAVRDTAKAYRQATEGEQTIKGDVIIDDVGAWNVVMQAAGFGSAQMAKNYDAREYIKAKEKRIAEVRSGLLKDYYNARKSGDLDEVKEVIERIKAFNAIHHPGERITGKSLALSYKSKINSNNRTQGGVYLSRKREYLREEGAFAKQAERE